MKYSWKGHKDRNRLFDGRNPDGANKLLKKIKERKKKKESAEKADVRKADIPLLGESEHSGRETIWAEKQTDRQVIGEGRMQEDRSNRKSDRRVDALTNLPVEYYRKVDSR